ncbi:MAG: hypothetical protein SWO11_02155 [Thermodesulfobacteriota bacterium]|nr:hypothetical protein [Thermodesulfobacteriota bacterium]
MGTILFVILHFLGHTDAPNEWYTVCLLISLDTISISILIVANFLRRSIKQK